VWHVVELPDAEHVRLVLDHRRLVVIDVQIIRRREQSHDARETSLATLRYMRYLSIIPAPTSTLFSQEDGRERRKVDIHSILGFVCADDREQTIAVKKLAHGFIRVEVGAAPHVVVHKVLRTPFLSKVLDRVRPQDIAHET
jgi:hypothetical protein